VNLLVSGPSKCQFVRDLKICIRRDSESLVYAALANLPNLQSLSLRLVDRYDNELMGPTTSSATSTHGLQLVFEHCINLRRLEVTAQSLPIDSCRLPSTISNIVLDAAALDEVTATNLQQAGVTTLELVFLNETDTELAILPWNSLQKLTLNFCLDNGAVIEACIRRLGEQVRDSSAQASLLQLLTTLRKQSLNGSKAMSLQELDFTISTGVSTNYDDFLDTLICAFQNCEVTALIIDCPEHDLNMFSVRGGWPALTHLSLSVSQEDLVPVRVIPSQGAGWEESLTRIGLQHRLENLEYVLQRCGKLISLTIAGMDFTACACDCCEMFDLDDFIECDEEEWAPEGRNLIATVHLVRHQTQIRDLRIQGSSKRRELRWTRANAAEDFTLERYTLF
jgi:hypothetical protein